VNKLAKSNKYIFVARIKTNEEKEIKKKRKAFQMESKFICLIDC
jgi:hypothetical protein